jgi:hypothetical protein
MAWEESHRPRGEPSHAAAGQMPTPPGAFGHPCCHDRLPAPRRLLCSPCGWRHRRRSLPSDQNFGGATAWIQWQPQASPRAPPTLAAQRETTSHGAGRICLPPPPSVLCRHIYTPKPLSHWSLFGKEGLEGGPPAAAPLAIDPKPAIGKGTLSKCTLKSWRIAG